MDIKIGGLDKKEVVDLLQTHLNEMHIYSPAKSVHALDLSKLQSPEITFWSVWLNEELAGCGALKELSKTYAEIKSMRTSSNHLRKGVAENLLIHILNESKSRSYKKVSLETGTNAAFLPAQHLYEKYGFSRCEPFGNYSADPFSTFMTKVLHV